MSGTEFLNRRFLGGRRKAGPTAMPAPSFFPPAAAVNPITGQEKLGSAPVFERYNPNGTKARLSRDIGYKDYNVVCVPCVYLAVTGPLVTPFQFDLRHHPPSNLNQSKILNMNPLWVTLLLANRILIQMQCRITHVPS